MIIILIIYLQNAEADARLAASGAEAPGAGIAWTRAERREQEVEQ